MQLWSAYHLARKSGNFCLKSNGKVIFREYPVRKLNGTSRGTPLFPLGTEQRKFPYHLLNFPVSSLLSAENNYGKSNCKWYAPFRSVGLLILEKPLPLFNARPSQFILKNGRHRVLFFLKSRFM